MYLVPLALREQRDPKVAQADQVRGAEKETKDLRESLETLNATTVTPSGWMQTNGMQITQKFPATEESFCKDLKRKETRQGSREDIDINIPVAPLRREVDTLVSSSESIIFQITLDSESSKFIPRTWSGQQ